MPLPCHWQEEADKEAEALKVAIVRAGKDLPEDAVAPSDSCNTIRDRILNFLSKDLALMTLLANPGIKERHWEQMAATVGFALPHSEVRDSALREWSAIPEPLDPRPTVQLLH